MRLAFVAVIFAVLSINGKAQSHEFWISPEAYTVEAGDTLTSSLRVGTEFEGAAVSYLPRSFDRFDLVLGDIVQPVEGRLGDNPALNVDDLPEGLAIIVHQTSGSRVNWTEWERFAAFAEHKAFTDIEARHMARGLPRDGFAETYVRYAKSLVAIGDGAGADREVGLTTEIVALRNPYTDDLSEGLEVQVFHEGMVRADAQVELFDRAPDGSVTITLHRTDAQGIARLPVEPGHEYLADAVVLEPIEPVAENDPVWLTLWASLTFEVPAR